MRVSYFFIMMPCATLSVSASAADSKSAKSTATESASAPREVTWDNFMCKSVRDTTLENLKEDLITYCDLNRPFTVTEGTNLTASSKTTFCCHKKAK